MILSCNSCEKKFVVPDDAIGPSGRLVQCSSCGNKWKQLPVISKNKNIPELKKEVKKVITSINVKRKKSKKRTGPNLYSPEYLVKKHGLEIGKSPIQKSKTTKDKSKTNFGFYSYLIVSFVSLIAVLRVLYFSEEYVIDKFPFAQLYIDYLFEALRNIKEIAFNFLNIY